MRLRTFPAWLALFALLPLAAGAAEDAAADKTDKAASEHKLTQSKSYLSLEPIYTTIVDDNRAQGMLMVGMGLDVPDEGLRLVADRSLPVLRDAYVRSLVAYTATAIHTDAQPDVGLLADRLQAITDRALGKKGAKVLLAQVAIRVSR